MPQVGADIQLSIFLAGAFGLEPVAVQVGLNPALHLEDRLVRPTAETAVVSLPAKARANSPKAQVACR